MFKAERCIVFLLISMFCAALISCAVGNPHTSTKGMHSRDTSFTVYSAYVKEVKKYPFIKIAAPAMSEFEKGSLNVKYKSLSNSRWLLADVYYPKARLPVHPAVLLIHGGGWKSGDKSQMAAMATVLAKHGFVSVAAEYRLSPEAQYPAALNDLKDALKWMRSVSEKYTIDTSNVAVLGVSAGGQLAALLGTIKKEKDLVRIKAVVDIDGILAFHHAESEEGQSASEWLGGPYEQKPLVWHEASPLTHAGRSTPPMLFINSQHTRFHAGRDDLIRKVSPYGIYTEVQTIPGTPHTFWLFDPWFEPAMSHIITFLNKTFSYDGRKG